MMKRQEMNWTPHGNGWRAESENAEAGVVELTTDVWIGWWSAGFAGRYKADFVFRDGCHCYPTAADAVKDIEERIREI